MSGHVVGPILKLRLRFFGPTQQFAHISGGTHVTFPILFCEPRKKSRDAQLQRKAKRTELDTPPGDRTVLSCPVYRPFDSPALVEAKETILDSLLFFFFNPSLVTNHEQRIVRFNPCFSSILHQF